MIYRKSRLSRTVHFSKKDQIRLGVIGARSIGSIQGGIEHYCSNFYTRLKPHGFDVTIFVRWPVRSGEIPTGINICLVRVPRSKSFETILHSFASTFVAPSLGIDTLHVHGIGSCLPLPLAKLFGMRVIVRHIGADYHRTKWGILAKTMLRVGERFAAKYADSVVCLNRHIANDFSQATGRTTRIYVVPNGIDASFLPAISHQDLLPIASRRYILAVGRLVPEKNYDLLLTAFLQADIPVDVKLVIAGAADYEGTHSRALRQACKKSTRVVTPGALFGSQLDWLFQNAGLFVAPSSHEGMSFSLLRASVAGLKIIASDIPGNSEVCRNFGCLVPPGSAEKLQSAIEKEWLRARSSAEIARQITLCKARHDWHNVVQQMIPILAHDRNGGLDGRRSEDTHSMAQSY